MLCPRCSEPMDRAGEGWHCAASGCQRHVPQAATVWMTTGSGATYHAERDCEWLAKGQEAVARRGGDPAPVRAVTRDGAQARGRAPCRACTPRDWRF